jgi:hypothetical protein
MKMLLKAGIAALLPAFLPFCAAAQLTDDHCAIDLLYKELRAKNPAFDAQLAQNVQALETRMAADMGSAQKTAATKYKVQVVFHFVLDSGQVKQLGGATGIQTRVNSQIAQLNTDWNARNPDSVKTPAPFKALRGNMGVEFVLAKRDPLGKATPGYEIVYTKSASYDIQGNTAGSTVAYSDAKYKSSGGAAAWDPQRYYNVWVLNMLPAGVLGIATPPRRPPFDLFPEEEQGTCILYSAFGRRSNAGEYYGFPQAEMGRTLTHETGHFFNLFHVWGSDNTCSDDDGIGDTPLQATNTANDAPTFPVLDACTGTGSGIMFMNFMDYAIDTAQSLFTKGQVTAVHTDLDAGGLRNSLILAATTAVSELPQPAATMTAYPNPAANDCRVRFGKAVSGSIQLVDLLGRELQRNTVDKSMEVRIDLNRFAPGVYMLNFIGERGAAGATMRLIKE